MSVNQRLLDAAISHAVDLQQYGNHVVRKIIALLNRTDADLVLALSSALDIMGEFSVERLESLLASVRMLNAQAYEAVSRELSDELRRFVEYELAHQQQALDAALPQQVVSTVGIATVDAEQVRAAAMARPFQGRLLREWTQSLPADRAIRIRDTVRIGFAQQQTIAEIVRRIRGTRAKGYADGILEVDRRHAESVVRTAISHTAAYARDRFFERNDELIKAVEWRATLDSRTSEGCRLRDGLQYTPETHKPIGHQVPWSGGPGMLHWNCRSVGVPVLKSWKELGGEDFPEWEPQTRASMDGEVPADTTYASWIKRQPAARQDQVLGPTRGALLRRGGLTLDSFYNEKGRSLSIAEMKARDADAFRRAGLQ